MADNLAHRDREIRDIWSYLTKVRGHSSPWIRAFIQRNYFISNVYKVLERVDSEKVNEEQVSITYKIVMRNEYQNI